MDTRKKLKFNESLNIIRETDTSVWFSEVEKNGLKLEDYKNRTQVMDKCEFEEKHLQDALKNQCHDIPTPQFDLIQEDIYSELYPKLKRQPNELKTVLLPDTNYCDYDADEEDEEWLKHHLRISLNQFEKVIEWLELNSKKFVPLLNDLKKSKVTKGLHKNDKEAIFDYWIDKRITSKKRMIPIVKIDNSTTITSASNVDPYKVFRKPQEMICNTRHRRRPHFNLKIHAEKALKEVTDLKHKLNILRDLKDKEYHRHMKLKEGFANFIMEYRHERYSQDEISYFKSLNKENQVETLSNSSGFENIDNDYDEDYGPYSFERKFCNLKYYKPKEF